MADTDEQGCATWTGEAAPRPTIGRRVHFRQNDRCYTATIVRVWSDACVNLFVPPTGAEDPVPGALSHERTASSVMFDDKLHGRDWTWHWPDKA
jgi:hypothetical protein